MISFFFLFRLHTALLKRKDVETINTNPFYFMVEVPTPIVCPCVAGRQTFKYVSYPCPGVTRD